MKLPMALPNAPAGPQSNPAITGIQAENLTSAPGRIIKSNFVGIMEIEYIKAIIKIFCSVAFDNKGC